MELLCWTTDPLKLWQHTSYSKLSETGLKYWMLNRGSSGEGQGGMLEGASMVLEALFVCVLNIWTPFNTKVEEIGIPEIVIYVPSSPITLKQIWSTMANVNIYSVKCLVKWFSFFFNRKLIFRKLISLPLLWSGNWLWHSTGKEKHCNVLKWEKAFQVVQKQITFWAVLLNLQYGLAEIHNRVMNPASVTSLGGTTNFRIDLKPSIFDTQVIWNNYLSRGRLKIIHSDFLLWKLILTSVKVTKDKVTEHQNCYWKDFVLFSYSFLIKTVVFSVMVSQFAMNSQHFKLHIESFSKSL